jgi:hypothetical protein
MLRVLLEQLALLLAEGEGMTLLPGVGNYWPSDTGSYPRRQGSLTFGLVRMEDVFIVTVL